tara:strand:+ start:368 stop:526 length:159 start_codon:yes stop_codon:yes gene_type:complete
LYDYEKTEEEEMSLKSGEIIYVTKKDNDGWFYGYTDNNIGRFPQAFTDQYDD